MCFSLTCIESLKLALSFRKDCHHQDKCQSSNIHWVLSLTHGSGRSPAEGNGSPLYYSCLENPMDREAWWATVHGVTKSWTWLSDFTFFTVWATGKPAVVQCRKIQTNLKMDLHIWLAYSLKTIFFILFTFLFIFLICP